MIVNVTFNVDTENKTIAYGIITRLFASLCLPETIKSMLIEYPKDK